MSWRERWLIGRLRIFWPRRHQPLDGLLVLATVAKLRELRAVQQ